MTANAHLSHVDLIFGAFAGRATAGAISLSNEDVQVGDTVGQVVRISGPADGQESEVYFETTISVAGQIQQTSATNLSGCFFLLVLRRTPS